MYSELYDGAPPEAYLKSLGAVGFPDELSSADEMVSCLLRIMDVMVQNNIEPALGRDMDRLASDCIDWGFTSVQSGDNAVVAETLGKALWASGARRLKAAPFGPFGAKTIEKAKSHGLHLKCQFITADRKNEPLTYLHVIAHKDDQNWWFAGWSVKGCSPSESKIAVDPFLANSARPLSQLVGKHHGSQEVRNLIQLLGGEPRVSEYDSGRTVYNTWPEMGISLLFKAGLLDAVFLYRQGAEYKQYPGKLPCDLRFDDLRRSVEHRLGEPDEWGGHGIKPYWIKYHSKNIQIKFVSPNLAEIFNPISHVVILGTVPYGESDVRSTSPRRKRWLRVATLAIVLAITFLLTFAPALCFGPENSRSRIAQIYAPVVWIGRVNQLRSPIEWWCGVWKVPDEVAVSFLNGADSGRDKLRSAPFTSPQFVAEAAASGPSSANNADDSANTENSPDSTVSVGSGVWVKSGSSISSAPATSESSSPRPTGFRTWTDRNNRKVEAELVSVTESIIRLRLRTGVESSVPLDRLSDLDRSFVQDWSRQSGAASKLPGVEGDNGASSDSLAADAAPHHAQGALGTTASIRDSERRESPVLAPTSSTALRIWTFHLDGRTFEAELIEQLAASVRLRLRDGREGKVPLDKLGP